jgi:transposase
MSFHYYSFSYFTRFFSNVLQRVCVRKVAVLKAVNLANKIRTKKIREDFRKLAKTSN